MLYEAWSHTPVVQACTNDKRIQHADDDHHKNREGLAMGATWEAPQQRKTTHCGARRATRKACPSEFTPGSDLGRLDYPFSTHDHSHEQQPVSVRTPSPHAILSQHHLRRYTGM